MVLSGMSDAGLIATLLAAFLLAIGLVRLLGRLIDADAPEDGWAEEPPDTNGTGSPASAANGTITDRGGPR
jgi:hypothetical protein